MVTRSGRIPNQIELSPGLFLERAREPVALYFAVGLALFAGSEPDGLSLIG